MSVPAYPVYLVEIAFTSSDASLWTLGTSPLDTGAKLGGPSNLGSAVFQPMTGFLSATVTRGRLDELGTIQAGTMTVLMDNADGRFSPLNTQSPYAPNILPRRAIRLSAIWQGQTWPVFYGWIDAWTPVDNSQIDSDMQISATDWFKWASRQLITATFPAQTEGDRIAAVLALTQTGNVPTAIDPGPELLLPATLVAVSPLQHIQDVLAAERGIFFQAPDGTLVYHNRHHRFTDPYMNNPQQFFQQVIGGGYAYGYAPLPYESLEYTLDDRFIYNDVRVQATGTAEPVAKAVDIPSQNVYGTNTLTISSPVMAAGQAGYLAQWLLAAYKDCVPRVTSLTVDGDANGISPAATPDLWTTMFTYGIGTMFTVSKEAPAAAGVERRVWIEGVRHTIRPRIGGHTVTWNLSDVLTYGPPPWQLDQSPLGGISGGSNATTLLVY